ncbi:unnamed protein product [Heligmosomoides polygyrus]|uniref:ZP domain-containing protein n=1 Tax=Heligmosomoides polygyrus TaxID=6339 RepID=A0A3P8C2H7_HELPZ|nr:unnamed protein product [Heligmosomoides polygyrus]
MVDKMENRVYVQVERDAQTALDRQFLFVCQLADAKEKEADIRRHPIVPLIGARDSYAVASNPADISTRLRVTTHMHRVQSNDVPRISAFSSDGHLGNWPIPGAHPYSPAVTPVVSWPKIPLPEPIIPQKNPVPRIPSLAMSEGVLAGSSDAYRAAPSPRPITTTPRNPFLHMGPAITPSRSGTDIRFHPGVEPIRPEYGPPGGTARSLADAVGPGAHLSGSYVTPNDVSARVESEQIVVGKVTPARGETVTEVPAYPWNKPYPGSPSSSSSSSSSTLQEIVPAADVNRTVSVYSEKPLERHWDKARIFKEEKPRIGVEFKTDNEGGAALSDSMGTATLVSNQEYLAPPTELSLEIQQGNGPFSPTVTSPVKIGDTITLVVRAKSQMKGEDDYDMFVHSCFASDGQGNTSIDLIDREGCVIRPQFVSPLNRTRDPAGVMYYFFRITAFKFPGPNDVYFSCSVEMTPFRNTSEICPRFLRARREASEENELRLFDSVKVDLTVQSDDRESLRLQAGSSDGICLSKTFAALLGILFAVLLVTIVGLAYLAMSFYLRLSTDRTKTLYSMY